jgi:hypothetical protein
MEAVKTWLHSQAADFFDTGIQKLILPGVVNLVFCGIHYKFYL